MQYPGQHRETRTDPQTAANEKMRQAVLCAFCHIIQTTGLRPMEVLALAATAVGSIYRDVATAHLCSDSCPCGWQPQPEADIELLQRLLAEASPKPDLRWLTVVGRA